MSLIDMRGKVVIVTGGARGIGKAIVSDFARVGASVVIADLLVEEARETAQEVSEATGQRVVSIATDITDMGQIEALKGQTLAAFGQIDVLVNNAGWDRFMPFLKSTPEFWDRVIDINYRGLLNMCYVMLPHMVERKTGVIINMASDAGRGGSFGESVYAGCKAGIIAFSKTLAREHARDRIRVNVVAPGITNTALYDIMADTPLGERMMTAIAKSVPLGRRAGYPEEISPTVVFLASDAAGYITGQVLSVNGGLTMLD